MYRVLQHFLQWSLSKSLQLLSKSTIVNQILQKKCEVILLNGCFLPETGKNIYQRSQSCDHGILQPIAKMSQLPGTQNGHVMGGLYFAMTRCFTDYKALILGLW